MTRERASRKKAHQHNRLVWETCARKSDITDVLEGCDNLKYEAIGKEQYGNMTKIQGKNHRIKFQNKDFFFSSLCNIQIKQLRFLSPKPPSAAHERNSSLTLALPCQAFF